MTKMFDDEWWHLTNDSTEPNPDYIYLERIIGTVQQALELQTICDKCDKFRAHGNHTKCSKLRQAQAVERRAREKV